MRYRLFHAAGLVVMAALILSARPADAQTVAAGAYYATPSWDQTFPVASRFIVLSNMNNEAVLDRETGLVWQRTPILNLNNDNRGIASINCSLAVTGGRQGWRLPRVDELASLADTSNSQFFQLHLPPGHPFTGLALRQVFWVADTVPTGLAFGGMVVFFDGQGVPGAYLNTLSGANNFTWAGANAWCVRGGNGNL